MHGSAAKLTFAVDPSQSKAYLAYLWLEWHGVTPASPSEVDEPAKRKGWKLRTGRSYLANQSGRSWNG
ncbi:dehydrogenase with NAD(P)-binding domain and groES-like domain [Streptomyces laurentii]|uniref:Dehydrogenase with NAD(P)-binding domain and groES-like domain n=1 Tax=Streptomyces laurentii TaxID=39478 RepID=A0A161JVU5_STRLU|nr:dehydrogenase with NAD(P)-binding domain and groES-like domain [Streptomyces laurentii]